MNVLKYVSYGVYIVTSEFDKEKVGCVINTLCQINSKGIVTITINKDNYTNKVIRKAKSFAVSILKEDVSMDLISDFGFKSSQDVDKFKNVKWEYVNEIPVVLDCCGYIICDVENIIDAETHDIFVGRIKDGRVLSKDKPLTYAYYQEVKKGTTPPKASSFIEDKEEVKDNEEFKRYQCMICGHIYDEKVEGIKFEDLPDNWVCPKCKVGKDKFKRIS